MTTTAKKKTVKKVVAPKKDDSKKLRKMFDDLVLDVNEFVLFFNREDKSIMGNDSNMVNNKFARIQSLMKDCNALIK